MRIGIDARILGTSRALDYYTRNLVASLIKLDKENQYVLLISGRKQLTFLQNLVVDYRVIPKKVVLKDHLLFKTYLKGLDLDLIFHPDNTEFLSCLGRSVVTLHDVVPWKFPELVLSHDPIENLRQRAYFSLQKFALKRSSQIITVSESSKKEIIETLGIDENKITVTYESIDERFSNPQKGNLKEVLKKYNIDRDYIFYIGGLEEYKNVRNLIEAYSQLSRKEKLVIGGKTEGQGLGARSSYPELINLIKSKGLYDWVIFTGFIEDQDLPLLYSEAKVFVYPSLYEGFGIPPLEALKSGVPVVASNIPPIKELVGEAALLIDPLKAEEIALAIKKVIKLNSEERDILIKEGKDWVDKFSWEKTALKTIEIFNLLR